MHDTTPRRDASGEYAGRSVAAELWEQALQEVQARRSHQVMPSRGWFGRLPAINRWLLGSGSAGVLLGLFCLIGVPILGYGSAAVRAAIYPLTAAGKRETCFSHLQQVAEALAQYRADYDDRLPVTEYAAGRERKTWMAALRDRGAEAGIFTCPTFGGQSDGQATGSYGANPLLLGSPASRWEKPDEVLMVGDRDEAHDTVLFPPFASWPVVRATDGAIYDPANLAYRHSEGGSPTQAAIVYADGHAGTMARGQAVASPALWGGSLVWDASLERLEGQFPLLAQVPGSAPGAFAGRKVALRTALGQLHALEKQTQANRFVHEEIEKRLWRGAGILRSLGDGAFEKQLTADLHEYDGELLKEAGGDWSQHESPYGFNLRYPGGWSRTVEADGRYHTTYFRPASPYIEVLVEYGERRQPTNATTINWTGMEASLKKRYGKGYRRIRMGYAALGGQTVSVWECLLKKPDGPRLRKIYFGRSTMWNSTILVCVAPAGDYEDWRPTFERIQQGFIFR
jgi:hypothetical protein